MALGHWLKDYIGPHSGGSGGSGGGTEPLIIHITDEEVKDPETQELLGYKTDVLASDAYEAWQNGRPIYYAFDEYSEFLVSSVTENAAVIIYVGEGNSITEETLFEFDGYLVHLEEGGGGGHD